MTQRESIEMETWLPLFFVSVMGFALLTYIVLDGYDLGIGILLPFADEEEKDRMIASIGPFWDANETWIVLGIGVLLIAFPKAHGVVLTALYLPVTLMLVGLTLRGVAFDFRAKAKSDHKAMWNRLFAGGSLLAACSQGWMLGKYVMGLEQNTISFLFATTSFSSDDFWMAMERARTLSNAASICASLACASAF
jgi:cytochrome d ubiquinol oxidase subunit II